MSGVHTIPNAVIPAAMLAINAPEEFRDVKIDGQ